jgi:hypothetical protein
MVKKSKSKAISTQPKKRRQPRRDRTGEELSAPIRPHFFAGELLAGEDLEAIPRWVRQRLTLQRFRCHPGVVCGLTVGLAPESRSVVLVQPGYAVGRDGDDLVLAKLYRIDLKDPCCSSCMGVLQNQSGDITIAGVPVHRNEVRLVDLLLLREDRPTRAQRIQDPCGCRPPQMLRCEHRRYVEDVQVDLKLGKESTPSPPPEPVKSPREAFGSLPEEQKKAPADWLQSQLSQAWAYLPFPFVQDTLDAYKRANKEDRNALLAQILFWLTLAFLERTYPETCARPDVGAYLARLWVQVDGSDVQVLLFDTSSQYRDIFCPCVAPCCKNGGDLGTLIDEPQSEAEMRLRMLGIPSPTFEEIHPQTDAEVNPFFESFGSGSGNPQIRTVSAGAAVFVQTVAWPDGQVRVVGFTRKTVKPARGGT